MLKKKIFITGGAGYVGSKLVPKLLDLGYEITVLDLMIYGENILNNHNKLKKIKGDIRNNDLLEKVIPGHDALIHLACISNDPRFKLNPSLGSLLIVESFLRDEFDIIINSFLSFVKISTDFIAFLKPLLPSCITPQRSIIKQS